MDRVLERLFEEACSLQDTDVERAAELFGILLDKEYAPAQVKYATFLRVSGDLEGAMELLQAAADQGDTDAMVLLGCDKFLCGSTPEAKIEGAALVDAAAEKGDDLALQWRAVMSLAGGEAKAADLFLKNVKQDQAVSLVRGALSENVTGDMVAAKGFYKEANLPAVTDGYLLALKFCCHVCKKEFQDKKTLQVCSVCQGPRYCSTVCQKKDWPQHKTVCRKNERHGP